METLVIKKEENTEESHPTTGSKDVTTSMINMWDLNLNQEQEDPTTTHDKPGENTQPQNQEQEDPTTTHDKPGENTQPQNQEQEDPTTTHDKPGENTQPQNQEQEDPTTTHNKPGENTQPQNQEQEDPIRMHDKPGENTQPQTISSGFTVTPEDVLCDSCIEIPCQAQKSCLTCLVSYCEAHLRPHLENQRFQNHRLVEPLQDIECRTCEEHRLPLELYCLTDGCGVCVCCECEGQGHLGHSTVPVEEARRQIQTELQKKQGEIMKTVSVAENAVGQLQSNTASIESSVAGVRAVMEQQFYLLQGAVEEARRRATEVLEGEQRQALSQAEGIQAHLEQKSQELKKTLARVERLFRNKRDVDFLQEYSEWKTGAVDVCLPGLYVGLTDRLASFSCLLTESTQELCDQLKATYRDKLKDICRTEKLGVTTMVHPKMSRSFSLPEPEMRDDFLTYASSLTFDPDTVHKFLRLTEDDRKVTNTTPWQHSYPDMPERFEYWRQVMTSESFYLGRHYFEAELSGEGVHVGLTYKSIDRKGVERGSCITGNDFSWSLGREGRSFSTWHADMEAVVEATSVFTRIGVYIDFDSGSLAFYGVTDVAMTLLYRYKAEFMEPLYPTVWLSKKDSVVLLVGPKDPPLMKSSTLPATPITPMATSAPVTPVSRS
ncbi:tripartite motif-containing protein 16-like protein [Salvelinus fontinalis]|uniref:tripartite motif-containing protein 16-like protein n=1 Tax=Salvelinus fontinalis TaxID=8038 RepID=UPI002485C990|nr:tripartite motif-containing protein 16-like protein [Salvelinus fontinalis]